jgi:hypothetical protein
MSVWPVVVSMRRMASGRMQTPCCSARAWATSALSGSVARCVEYPPGPDAQGFADAFTEDVTGTGLCFGDAVGPDAASVGMVPEDHAYV